MNHMTDLETRVLGVVEQHSGLDVEQIASAGRLSIELTTQALDTLTRRDLIDQTEGKFGPTFQLNRPNVQKLIAA